MMTLSLLKRGAALLLTSAAMAAGTHQAHALGDVTQPGDPIFASSANSPGSEGVANAIDGQPTKYLNFDQRNGEATSGFAVTPSVGATVVTGLTLQSANDAVERDPKAVLIEGTNDDIASYTDGNWEVITQIDNITAWETLFPGDDRFQTQTFEFANLKAYKSYRWTVLDTQTQNGCCMQIAEVELLGKVLPGDVTQPGDTILASSANSPGSEGVANAIDGQPTKYLNFDQRNGEATSGFVVSPSIGSTVISGVTMQSANDAVERDPKAIRIEGSNDAEITDYNSGNWEVITEITDIPAWETLFPGDDRFQTQTFLFANVVPYAHYRWTVLDTQTQNGCCMQIAEVELLGTGAPQDVTQPGDAIYASSANSPGSEGVANAIDGQPTKYLNFDQRNGEATSGFAVTPSVGATTITGVSMQSANDAVERDPKAIRIEGSNDAEITDYNSGNWETITEILDIPAWETLFPGDDRFQTQTFYFANDQEYLHYRWTVLDTQTQNGCCMQIAEVELLAVTDSVDCEKAKFLTQPVDTPVLEGSAATFFVEVNGPWPIQWYRNGEKISGGTGVTYTTGPITADNAGDTYFAEIVGCEASVEVAAQIFTPSTARSIALNFPGEGANGAPTRLLSDDIGGVHLQAYWNNTTPNLAAGTNSDGITNEAGDTAPFVDSNNAEVTDITVSWAASSDWGAGTGDIAANQKLLNGMLETGTGTTSTVTFNNVPAGNHAVLAYFIARPLEFPDADFTIVGQDTLTYYVRQLNADEYNPAPGFFRGTSTDPDNRALASYVRFDNVQANGGTITLEWTGQGGGAAVLSGVQLVLNAPDVGSPPEIVTAPQPGVGIEGGTLVLTSEVNGDNLSYQWRKDGKNVVDGGNISGATTDTLTIRRMTADDEGIYTLAVFNQAGSLISRRTTVRLSTFEVEEGLVAYFPLDETSGTTAGNAATGGVDGEINGTSPATWTTGQIGNALNMQGENENYVYIPDYTKGQAELSAALWVNVDEDIVNTFDVPMFFRNADGIDLNAANPAEQFELGLIYNDATADMNLSAAITSGPNVTRFTQSVPFPLGEWVHVAFSVDGAQLRLYLNGERIGTVDYVGTINPPTVPYLSMGARLVDDGNGNIGPDFAGGFPDFMHGSIDDVALWIRGITGDEVSKIYEAGLAGNPLTSVVLEKPTIDPGELPGDPEIALDGGNISITWEGGALQSATDPAGPYSEIATESPYTEAVDGQKYFRTQGTE